METTPVSLLERVSREGDAESWSQLVELCTPLLLRWAARAGVPQHAALDLVQDVFVILVQELPDFVYDEKRSFRAWLKTVTLNRWREQLRKRTPELLNENHDSMLETQDSVDDFWDREFNQELARRALQIMQQRFESATWQACWQTLVEGNPAEKVAAELGLSVGAVYAAKCRVLRVLRQELSGMMD